jgi:hypothetical protein
MLADNLAGVDLALTSEEVAAVDAGDEAARFYRPASGSHPTDLPQAGHNTDALDPAEARKSVSATTSSECPKRVPRRGHEVHPRCR